MQDYLDKHSLVFAFVFPIFFVTLWCAVCFLISQVAGWATLARRFRSTSPFVGQTWGLQSGRMRWTVGYGNILTVGSNPMGMYLAAVVFFRVGHPPLFLPWQEVTVKRRWTSLFFKHVELRLGREEQIPLMISGRLADRIRLAAGPCWLVEAIS